MKMKIKINVNADDFGISKGVNSAVLEMFKAGKLNSASIIVNGNYFNEAIKIAKQNPNLKIGLHFNLTTGNSISGYGNLPLLTRKNGWFKNGFVAILFLILFRKKSLLREVNLELAAQIKMLKHRGIKIDHINSHRHIHFLPGIFNLVTKIAAKYQIKDLRIINENFINSWKMGGSKSFLWNGGIIKWLLLRFLGMINGSAKIKSRIYFFSILYSCNISKELIAKLKIPDNFSSAEIMIHPGNPAIDMKSKGKLLEKSHLLSPNRYRENL